MNDGLYRALNVKARVKLLERAFQRDKHFDLYGLIG